ncbi:MAG: trigger factor [Bacteroidales bacterium]|nr:trigger factor [Bacteroidales bacterium]
MDITKENTGDLTAVLKVKVTEDDYKEAVDKKLKDYRKKAQMPGFRPGRVPMGMVKKMYGNAIIVDEVNNLISSELGKYIMENKLQTLGNPLPSDEHQAKFDVENDTEFEFFFDIALQPEIDINIDESIEADYYNIDVDDKMVDNYLEDIRRNYGKHTNPETVDDKDVVYADFKEIDSEGNVVEEGVENNSPFAVDKIELKTYKQKIIGSRVGDSIDWNPRRTFKNDADVATMLGIDKEDEDKLKADYRATITSITRVEPAELNEELFNQVYQGDNIQNEEELRERIRKDTSESLVNESEKMFFDDVVEQLKKKAEIKLPETFMKRWLKENNRNLDENQRLSEKDIEDNYEQYAEGMTWQLLQNKIITDNELKVTEDEVKSRIRELLAMQMGMPQSDNEELNEQMEQIVNSVMQNEKETNRIYDELYERKIGDLFKEKITINEKNISYDDFVKLAQDKKNKK